MPSKTGGPSSNRGTDWPGTNSARWIRISIVEGATTNADAPPVALVDQLDGVDPGGSRVGDDHLVDRARR